MPKRAKLCLTCAGRVGYRSIMNAKILKLTDVARYLGVPKRTLYNMLNDGRFPVLPIPNTQPRRWNIEDIDKWRGAAIADGERA